MAPPAPGSGIGSLAGSSIPPTTGEIGGSLPGFGATKREILLTLKRDGETDLQALSKKLHLSKMAVHRHLAELENHGLVVRVAKRTGVGRPRLVVALSPSAGALFPKVYGDLTCAALKFIEQKLGRPAVEEALRTRMQEVRTSYEKKVRAGSLGDRVGELAALRDSEGYMAESKRGSGRTFEILEHNCPILAVAEKYQEACTVETDLFRRVLHADVTATHRVVAGNNVCRFLVRPRPDDAGGR